MNITIVYDNESARQRLTADWGFACAVDLDSGHRLLFDTGASSSILLSNLEKLDIEPFSFSWIVISHSHWDHIGGLPELLGLNSKARVYIPASCPLPGGAAEPVVVKDPCRICQNVFSTGELEGVEQSLVLKTETGLAVVTGCSHPGVKAILEAASNFGKPNTLIGGLHGFREFDLLAGLDLVCPCHCTQHKAEIKKLYPEKYAACGAGNVIEI